MNKTLTLSVAAATLLLTSVTAQGPSQDELIERKAQKLEQAFLENGNWLTDYTAAKKAAKEQGKSIFAYFTRSYSP